MSAPSSFRPIRWAGLSLVAIGGSLLYGASLAIALANYWEPGEETLFRGALWLTLSAGSGWIALGPALRYITGKDWFTLADACLVAMAWGEGVLLVSAVLNTVGWGGLASNVALVAASNGLMATVLSAALKKEGVPTVQTMALWWVVLNGVGLTVAALLYPGLLGRA